MCCVLFVWGFLHPYYNIRSHDELSQSSYSAPHDRTTDMLKSMSFSVWHPASDRGVFVFLIFLCFYRFVFCLLCFICLSFVFLSFVDLLCFIFLCYIFLSLAPLRSAFS